MTNAGERMKKWREQNPERARALARKTNSSESRRVYLAGWLSTEAGRASSNQAKAAWRRRNPEKTKAHAIYKRGLRAGILVRSKCEVCGAEHTHGHHNDYSKPLEVQWLCRKHHAEIHRK